MSYGYHADDGNVYNQSGTGISYGPTFTTGDVVGCCVNFIENNAFFTKNGTPLGGAFRDLKLIAGVFPTVGLRTIGECVDVNFGYTPFVFDINSHVKVPFSSRFFFFLFPFSKMTTTMHHSGSQAKGLGEN